MYYKGQGVPKDYALAHMWFNLSGSNGFKLAVVNRNTVENEMSKPNGDNFPYIRGHSNPY